MAENEGMTSRPWYPFFWSDYSGKTLHLSMAQHGAYILLLRWVYTTGTPVPHKRRFSIAQARLDSERSDVEAMLGEFFVRKGDGWHNLKAEEVMQDAEKRHQKLVEAGRAGGKARSSDAQAMLEDGSSDAQASTTTPINKQNSKSFNRNSLGGMGRNGSGHVTIKDPSERLARFQKLIAENVTDGWMTVTAACSPDDPAFVPALALCKAAAGKLGKGWPHQWPKANGAL